MADDPDIQAAASECAEGNAPRFSPDGVDLTLIRWMLSLTPAERLRVLQQNVRSLERLRGAGTRA